MQKIIGLLALVVNHTFELIRFVKYSNCFSNNTIDKLRGKIIFNYHSIEKGLINSPMRMRFGKIKINRLKRHLSLWFKRGYSINDSQFLSACAVLKDYCNVHKNAGINIEDVISESEFTFFTQFSKKNSGGTITFQNSTYFREAKSSFNTFSDSRHSVRHFDNKQIDITKIKEVIDLARNAPSVCNRQGFKVKFINNKKLVQDVLQIQNGLNATAKSVQQLFIVSVDRSVFVSAAEWYQGFIDGGIFLQNLLYSLHYHEIAAVSLNWSKHYFLDLKMEKLLNLHPSEKIISVVAVGYPVNEFKVPQSTRKEVSEILEIIS
jgi:nitroreductase